MTDKTEVEKIKESINFHSGQDYIGIDLPIRGNIEILGLEDKEFDYLIKQGIKFGEEKARKEFLQIIQEEMIDKTGCCEVVVNAIKERVKDLQSKSAEVGNEILSCPKG